CRYFLYFIIYSFLGWIYETCYCTIHEKAWENRGFLYGPCIPLYGVGATLAQIIFIDIPCDNLRNASYPMIFLICAAGSFVLEYSTSYVLEKRFHARWWDYSEFPINIHGRVCLIFTMCFGFAGIIVTQIIVPPIMQTVLLIPSVIVELLALIFMFLFGMDMALTISSWPSRPSSTASGKSWPRPAGATTPR
ncbi:MAG: putative ABC transporter permease, partial [Firmicutes bacterium]|nr:putative ABC transporter permease [Bacillota bacterium]